MTRIYVMESCPDCNQAKQLYGNNPAFAKVRERGTIVMVTASGTAVGLG